MARSATYRQLQTVLETPGCPICYLGQQAGHGYLDNLLWESVNDPGVTKDLGESLGFCGRHSRELLSFAGERLGVAIIQRSVLRAALHHLDRFPAPSGRTLFQRIQDALGSAGQPTGVDGQGPALTPCPACIHQDEVETRALRTLLAHFTGDLDGPLQASGGLCWPHLRRSIQMGDSAQVGSALVELHRQLWSDLAERLGEFIRKNDHRFRTEQISDEERAAIDRSIALLTGGYSIR